MSWKEQEIIREKDACKEAGRLHCTSVEGRQYTYWAVPMLRGTFAESEEGEIKQIHGSGYITNDLTARKEIAVRYGHKTFRK